MCFEIKLIHCRPSDMDLWFGWYSLEPRNLRSPIKFVARYLRGWCQTVPTPSLEKPRAFDANEPSCTPYTYLGTSGSFLSCESVPRASRCPNWKPATSALGFIFKRRSAAGHVDVDVDVDASSFPMRRPDVEKRETEREKKERECVSERRTRREKYQTEGEKISTFAKRKHLRNTWYVAVCEILRRCLKEKYYSRRDCEFQEFIYKYIEYIKCEYMESEMVA